MRIGMTYDLRSEWLARGYSPEETAEFDRDETIDAVEQALWHHGDTPERIGSIFSLTEALAAGKRWDLIFNIAEGLHGFGREAQVPALCEAYGIPCTFSDPLTLCVSLHKETARRLVTCAGLPATEGVLVSSAKECAGITLPCPLFVKPVAEGTSKGIDGRSLIVTPADLAPVVTDLLARFGQPVLVERHLSGPECTVGILGTGTDARTCGVLSVCIEKHAPEQMYSYNTKERCEELVTYTLLSGPAARRAEELALAVWRVLGGRDGGRIDLKADDSGHWRFIEANPLAGLHPTHSDLPIMWGLAGRSYNDLIRDIVESARMRPAHRSAGRTLPCPNPA